MFEVGDKVLISRAGGWPWINSMNHMIGYTGNITEIIDEKGFHGCEVSYRVMTNHPDDIAWGAGFWYPEESLEKI
jgi:hypothetical protein